MSITAVQILAFVNSVLHRTETNIDVQIQTVLDDLSQGPFIEATEDPAQTLADDDEYLDVPNNYLLMVSIVLNDGSNDLTPLKRFPGGYKALRDQKANTSTATTGHPEFYSIWADKIWLWPVAGQDYTSRIDFYKVHDQGVATIEFTDEWRNALYFGAAFEVACRYKLPDAMSIWGARFQDEKEKQRLAHPGEPCIVGS